MSIYLIFWCHFTKSVRPSFLCPTTLKYIVKFVVTEISIRHYCDKITLSKIVLVANAHAGLSNNARSAFEMTAIALPARHQG
jgi:hypothetical protein